MFDVVVDEHHTSSDRSSRAAARLVVACRLELLDAAPVVVVTWRDHGGSCESSVRCSLAPRSLLDRLVVMLECRLLAQAL